MCTVTVVPWLTKPSSGGDVGGFRLACNRDESRKRAAALPPLVRKYGVRRAILPVDPVSDGTWIAVNDRGVVITLLNVYEQPFGTGRAVRNPSLKSRGGIIPSLLGVESALEAAKECRRIAANEYPPFRLVIVDCGLVVEARSDGAALTLSESAWDAKPLLFTSSGLGDQVVEVPRRGLFEEMFPSSNDLVVTQDAFHCHSWLDRKHVSVCMSRVEAKTVSYTVVEVGSKGIRLCYFGDAPDVPVEPVEVELSVDP